AVYLKRFLRRFARIRLRRLCFEIFALRLFLREPITNFQSAVADPTTEQVRFQLASCHEQASRERMLIRPERRLGSSDNFHRAGGISTHGLLVPIQALYQSEP